MSELWEQITDNIDERFTDEAAEYFAKHSKVEYVEDSASSYDAKALTLKADKSEKKQSKGKIIAIACAAAAAVAICVLGGIHLMKNTNPLLPTDTSTTEASDTLETQETGETSEVTDVVVQPKINAVEAELILTDTIRDQDIIQQAGFDVPYEHYYDEEAIRKAAEYVNSLPDTDEKQQLIEQNYFNASLDVCYIGSDTADWICVINYDLCYYEGIIEPFYSRVFYVKDGLITENVFEADRASTVTRDSDYVYISKGSDGLFMLNTDTMAIQAITSDYAEFWGVYDEYVMFINFTTNTLQLYVRESGEIIPTCIYMGQHDGTSHYFMGDRIRFYDDIAKEDSDNEPAVYDFMLPSGEVVKVDMSFEDAFLTGGESDYYYAWYFNSGYNVEKDTLTDHYPEHSIIITDLSTGLTETLYLDDFSDTLYNSKRCNVGNLYIYGGVLYIPVYDSDNTDKIYIAYDIKTGGAMYFAPDEIVSFHYDGENLIGWSSEPYEWSEALTYSKHSKLTLKPVHSEAESSEWASMEMYNGDDEAAQEFSKTLSEVAQADNQAYYDKYLETVGEENLTEEDWLIIEQMQYAVHSYYVEANEGAEFWMKRYMRKGGQFFDFTEIYLRKGDEFTLVDTVDWLDVQYLGDTLVRCSGDYLYYSHNNGVVERISTSGEKEAVFDADVIATNDTDFSAEDIFLDYESSISGSGNVLTINYHYNYDLSGIFGNLEVQIDTDNNVLKQQLSGLGYEIVDGEALPFTIATGEHDHLEALRHDDVLLQRGTDKLSNAIKLYQIKENAGVAQSLESYEDVMALYKNTFAGTMYNYSGHYYSADTPSAAPWYTDSDRLKESLWSSIDANAGQAQYVQPDTSALHEYWTTIEGVLESGDNYVDYQLCTICKNTSKSIDSTTVPYYYEHSVMRLEKIDGEWKITQLRTRLGNEYGTAQLEELKELGYTVQDESISSYTEILCDLLREDGHDVIGTSAQDFDFDGAEELFVLAEKNGSKTIRVYEQQSYGWELMELISDEALNSLNTAQFIRYEEDEERTYQAMGNNRGILNIRFVANDDIYDNNRGEYVVEKLGTLLYKTPIEYPGVLGVIYERIPDREPDPQEFAEGLADSLMYALSDGDKDDERTFDVLDWEINKVEVTPVVDAPDFYNVTDEERALENAWIVEPEVRFTYEGKVSGKTGSADEWYEGLGADNIGFLMWQEGDTFFLRSRWLNGGTRQLMTDDELNAFLDESLQPALDIINLIYFSGYNARAAGMPQIEESVYEVAADFPYSSADEIKAAAAEYFTEDAVEQLNIGFWFPMKDGKLCAQTFNKGLSCSGYTAENAEILSQYLFYVDGKVVIKLKMTDWITKSQYSEDGYGIVTLKYDSVKGKWLFSDKLI